MSLTASGAQFRQASAGGTVGGAVPVESGDDIGDREVSGLIRLSSASDTSGVILRPKGLTDKIGARGRPEVRERRAGDDALQNVCQPVLRVEAIEFRRVEERRQNRPCLTAALVAGEQ